MLKLYAGKHNGQSRYKRITFRSEAAAKEAQRELASHALAHAAGTGVHGSPGSGSGLFLKIAIASERALHGHQSTVSTFPPWCRGVKCHSAGPPWVAMKFRKIRRISSAMLSPWSSA